jgi:hypothetical protein
MGDEIVELQPKRKSVTRDKQSIKGYNAYFPFTKLHLVVIMHNKYFI